jgi:chromosome partitioning protein
VRTIAVVSLKGGSGKTTVAAHLALAAHLRGLDTLVVDIDPQRSARDVLAARATLGPPCVASTGAQLREAKASAACLHKRMLVIDTPAAAGSDAGVAITSADLTLLVARPTLLDLAGLAHTLMLVRRLQKPAVVVLNQAPVTRGHIEPPQVRRALSALDYLGAPVAPAILRARLAYQTALESGRSAEETADSAAAREVAALWTCVDRALGAATGRPAYSSAIGFTSVPIGLTSTSQTSPAFIHSGGVRAAPTPAGVPVTMTSPGSRSVNVEQ